MVILYLLGCEQFLLYFFFTVYTLLRAVLTIISSFHLVNSFSSVVGIFYWVRSLTHLICIFWMFLLWSFCQFRTFSIQLLAVSNHYYHFIHSFCQFMIFSVSSSVFDTFYLLINIFFIVSTTTTGLLTIST